MTPEVRQMFAPKKRRSVKTLARLIDKAERAAAGRNPDGLYGAVGVYRLTQLWAEWRRHSRSLNCPIRTSK